MLPRTGQYTSPGGPHQHPEQHHVHPEGHGVPVAVAQRLREWAQQIRASEKTVVVDVDEWLGLVGWGNRNNAAELCQ